jgi:pyridoxal 5'-phosphate synthase pdxT subunit
VSAPKIGVLALQGAFREHIQALTRLGAEAFAVRSPDELAGLDGIVLPGGESTTMDKLLRKFGLKDELTKGLGDGLPALATCAGVILLAREVRDGLADQESLDLLPITVRRNAYGRQPQSFETELDIDGLDRPFPGVFIRAPLVERTSVEVEVLGSVDSHPVAFRCGRIIGLTFHPELTGDDRLHRLFLDDVADATRAGEAEETA